MPKKILYNRVSELVAIKGRREARRISLRDLSEETGLALSTVTRWYSNDVTQIHVEALLTWMGYFGCSLDELLIIEDEIESSAHAVA